MSHETEVLFLDAAGTLMEVSEPVGLTYARIAQEHGVIVDGAAMDHAFRCTWRELPPPLYPGGQPAEDDDRSWWRELVLQSFDKVLDERLASEVFEPMFATCYEHYAQPHAWRLFDDVAPALLALHGKLRLFVISNFDRRLRKVLHGLGIAALFERLIISSEVGAEKPQARIFEVALGAAGVPPERCFHAGDEENADVRGAEAVGIPAMRVKRPEVTLREIAETVRPGAFSCLHEARKCIPTRPPNSRG
jgi:putative hydrolase of the HAD superfamily